MGSGLLVGEGGGRGLVYSMEREGDRGLGLLAGDRGCGSTCWREGVWVYLLERGAVGLLAGDRGLGLLAGGRGFGLLYRRP